MRPSDYPAQEPLSAMAQRYHDELMRRGVGVGGEEIRLGDDPYQSLTVHPAAKPNGTLLAFIHGGGWTSGYKEWMDFMAPAFTGAGVTFVSIGYRLAPDHLFPAGLDDVARALAWVADAAKRYEVDPQRLFVGGHSAGGHYAGLLAVRRDWQEAAGLPRDIVRGCLPLSGVYDFTETSGLSQRPRFLGPEGVGTEILASPRYRIDGVPPPFLIAFGEDDFPHLMVQGELMAEVLRAAGGHVERLVLPGLNHFTASYAGGEPAGPWVPRALAWMQSV